MLSIYNYEDPVDFLSDFINERKHLDTDFSLKKWSSLMGFKSVSPLIDILKKRSHIKDSAFEKIIIGLSMDKSEIMYYQALVGKSRAQTNDKKKMFDLILKELSPEYHEGHHSCFRGKSSIFSNWLYMAILSIGKIKGFKLTAPSVHKILRFSVEISDIESAIDELLKGKFLVHDKDNRLVRSYTAHTTDTDVKNQDLRKYFEGVCDLAKMSINIPLDEREFQCFSMAIPKDKIPLAKEIIRKCRKQLGSLSCEDENDVAYQMNLMMFPLSKEISSLENQKGAYS